MADALTKPGGRPPRPIDPAEIERCAALGMNWEQIADGLEFSPRGLRERKADDIELRAAYKRGRFTAQQKALAQIDGHAEKNPIVAIFKGKHILGWHDNVGTASQPPQAIKVEISIGQAGATAVIAPEGDTEPLEAEYEEVE